MANGSILLTITNFASCPDYHSNRKLAFGDENESSLSK